MKRKTFHSSDKAIDVILNQLNIDINQNDDLIEQKSTVEQQFYNYLEVERFSQSSMNSLHCHVRNLDCTMG